MKHEAKAWRISKATWLATAWQVWCMCGYRCPHEHRTRDAAATIRCELRHEKDARKKEGA